eukprot:8630640-Pyramimonas_sp.AAC.1
MQRRSEGTTWVRSTRGSGGGQEGVRRGLSIWAASMPIRPEGYQRRFSKNGCSSNGGARLPRPPQDPLWTPSRPPTVVQRPTRRELR